MKWRAVREMGPGARLRAAPGQVKDEWWVYDDAATGDHLVAIVPGSPSTRVRAKLIEAAPEMLPLVRLLASYECRLPDLDDDDEPTGHTCGECAPCLARELLSRYPALKRMR